MTDQNSQFFAILTAVGEAKQANAAALGTSWTFAQMGVGDANETAPIPNRLQTKLINERRRAPLNQVKVDPTNPSVIIAEQVIPESIGGWWVRELALYDTDGDMVAVANCAPTYKPLLAQGSGRTQVIRINLIVSSTANIELKIDPSVVLATREYVDTVVVEALSKMDYKYSVLVATTANIVLSGIQTIDGELLPAGARVLVKDQAQAKDNGIYVVPAAGVWRRAQDADASIEVTPGLFVSVEKGTTNGDSVWLLVTDAPIVLGTTALAFEMAVGRTGISAGSYASVVVDKYGRVIAGTNPTTLAGYGITDAILSTPKTGVVGKISDIAKHHIGVYASGTTDGMPNSSGGLFLRMKYPGDTPAAFDIFGHVGNGTDILGFRRVLADGSFVYRTIYHDGNFDPSVKANKSTTLGGYGITDAYTKAQVDSVTTQLNSDVEAVASETEKVRNLSIQGVYRGILISATGVGSLISARVDQVIVKDGAGEARRISGLSAAINLATVGANGLDVGVLAASSFYSLWAINGAAQAFIAALCPVLTGATTAGSAVVTGLPSTSSLRVGMQLSSSAFPAGSVVQSIDSPSQINVSALALTTTAAASLRFVYEPVLPAGYTSKARVGMFLTGTNGVPCAYTQLDNIVLFDPTAGSNTVNYPVAVSGVASTPVSVSLLNLVPPTARKVSLVAGCTGGYVGFAPEGSFASTPGTGYLSPAQLNGFPFAGGYNASGPVPTAQGEFILRRMSFLYCATAASAVAQVMGWEDKL